MNLEDKQKLILASVPTQSKKRLDNLPLSCCIVDKFFGIVYINQGTILVTILAIIILKVEYMKLVSTQMGAH